MAVTQQIVRVPQAILDQAAIDPAVVEQLVCFEPVAAGDALDLDWAPEGILALAQLALPEAQYSAVKEALDGTTYLSSRFLDGPRRETVYSDVTCLHAHEVKRIAGILDGVNARQLLISLPAISPKILETFDPAQLPKVAEQEYGMHFTALVEFVEEAAERGLGLAMWWD